jgi:hypothetical protein
MHSCSIRTSSAGLSDMVQEINLGGVFVPAELIWAGIAYLLSAFIGGRLDAFLRVALE